MYLKNSHLYMWVILFIWFTNIFGGKLSRHKTSKKYSAALLSFKGQDSGLKVGNAAAADDDDIDGRKTYGALNIIEVQC